jgi:Ser/Thr protein kinase RdoA (MazF antagonist)
MGIDRMGAIADPILSSILSTPSPEVTETQAAEIARTHYGFEASAKKLASERDQMFRLREAGGSEYLLKVTNPAEPLAVTHLQTAALGWIAEKDPELPVQRIQRARDGATELRLAVGGTELRTVRLLSFLQGRPLPETAATQNQRRELGRTLARLGRALLSFHHPSDGYELAWDIANADRLRPLLAHVRGHDKQRLAQAGLERFESRVRPRLRRLRTQVVHNDLNTHNVLVDPADTEKVAGILDFGDIVRTQLVNDVAIGAAYHIMACSDPLQGLSDFIGAYQEITPLQPEEVELLPDLIATRLLVTVLITGWRAERYPENSAYILKNNAVAWDGLDRLAHIPPDSAQQRLRANITR